MADSEIKRYYVTTPIYYVNDKPHIGHAYTTLACDVLARFKRLDGYEVMFLTGTDEHGQKVEKAARTYKSILDRLKEVKNQDHTGNMVAFKGFPSASDTLGLNTDSKKFLKEVKHIDMTPTVFSDIVSENFRDLTKQLKFTNNDFIRTTEPRHHDACKRLWTMLREGGHIRLGSYSGWYAVRDEAFYTESEIIDGKAPSGAPVEWVEEPSYFFDLSKWQDKLLSFYEANPDFVAPPSRYNEVKSFVRGGLRDLSISRTGFSWGVPVPNDNKHVMYVWLDALTNYITATGWPVDGEFGDRERHDTFWPADVHVVGKDILRFHAVYWPAFLMAAGLPLPKRVFAHGWWTNEGEKISKSIGNVIDPIAVAKQYGLDQMRYYLLCDVPFGKDGDFSQTNFKQRINSDLANGLGNLVQRVLSMVYRRAQARIPALPKVMSNEDGYLLGAADAMLHDMRCHIDALAFHKALRVVWCVIAEANRYIDVMAPWALHKTNPSRMREVLGVLCEVIRQVAILIEPVMPDSSAIILEQMRVPKSERKFDFIAGKARVKEGTPVRAPKPVFPRYEDQR